MGMFDDLIPGAKQPAGGSLPGASMFADLIPPDQGGDTLRGAKVAFAQEVPTLQGAVGLLGRTGEEAFGAGGISTALKNWGLRGFEAGQQKAAPLQKDTDDLFTAWDRAQQGDLGALVDWTQYALGYGLAQGGISLAYGLLGGAAGALAAPEAAPVTGAAGAITGLVARGGLKGTVQDLIEKAVIREANALSAQAAAAGERLAANDAVTAATKAITSEIAQTATLLGHGIGQELGQIYPEAEKEAAQHGRTLDGADLARVWGWGVASGGLEGLTDKLGVDVALGKLRVPGSRTRLGQGALTGFGGAAVEGATEGAQTVMERLGAGQDPFSAEGIKDIVNSAALGAVGGGAISGAAGALHGAKPMPGDHASAGMHEAADRAFQQISEAGSVDEAIDAYNRSHLPLVVPQGFDGEGAMARLEKIRDADIKAQRLYGPAADAYRPPPGAASSSGAPGYAGNAGNPAVTAGFPSASAEPGEEEPFSDRLITLREKLSDSRTRQAIRDNLGPDALNDVLYYAQRADDASLPGITSDRMLQVAEAIVQRATVRPLTPTPQVGGPSPQGAIEAARGLPQIPLDTSPTGGMRVDAAGQAVPETRADIVSMRDRARAMAERRDGLSDATPRGGEPGAGVLVGQGVLTPGQTRPAPPQLPAPPGQPGKRGAFEQAEADAAAAAAAKPEEKEAIAAAARAAAPAGPTAMELALRTALDRRAHEGAESPTNGRPVATAPQAKAGNYKLGHDATTFPGLDLSIENAQGSTRRDKNHVPPRWQTLMRHHYGYLKRTTAYDSTPGKKQGIDFFANPGTPEGYAGPVYVVDQIDPATGRFDEHKAMLGFPSEKQARKAYLANYDAGWKGMGAITRMSFDEFKAWAYSDRPHAGAVSLRVRANEMAGKPTAAQKDEGAAPGETAPSVAPDISLAGGPPAVRGDAHAIPAPQPQSTTRPDSRETEGANVAVQPRGEGSEAAPGAGGAQQSARPEDTGHAEPAAPQDAAGAQAGGQAPAPVAAPAPTLKPVNAATKRALRERGEQVISRLDAERRFDAGDRLFVFHDLDEGAQQPMEATSVLDLNGYTADQILALPAVAAPAPANAAPAPQSGSAWWAGADLAARQDMMRRIKRPDLADKKGLAGWTWDKLSMGVRASITIDLKVKPQAPNTLPAVQQRLYVHLGDKRYEVESLADAQAKWVKFRDATGEGVSVVGNGVRVVDQDGKLVARVAYNGRLFSPDDKVLAEAPGTGITAGPGVTSKFEQAGAEAAKRGMPRNPPPAMGDGDSAPADWLRGYDKAKASAALPTPQVPPELGTKYVLPNIGQVPSAPKPTPAVLELRKRLSVLQSLKACLAA